MLTLQRYIDSCAQNMRFSPKRESLRLAEVHIGTDTDSAWSFSRLQKSFALPSTFAYTKTCPWNQCGMTELSSNENACVNHKWCLLALAVSGIVSPTIRYGPPYRSRYWQAMAWSGLQESNWMVLYPVHPVVWPQLYQSWHLFWVPISLTSFSTYSTSPYDCQLRIWPEAPAHPKSTCLPS